MPFGPDHERWADSTASFLLGAMPDDERAGFEAHLAECEFCREEVEFLRVASDALPSAVPQLAPPPELRSRIMAVVEREAELLQAAGAPREPAPAPRPAPWWRRLGVVPRRAGLALGAALLLLVGGVGGALVSGGGDPSLRTLDGIAETPGTEVRLVVAGDQGRLEVENLPVPPRGRVYQVWVQRPGRDPEPTDALFVPAADGSASAGVPASLEDAEAVLVTDEPRGGSRVPTGRLVLRAPVTAS